MNELEKIVNERHLLKHSFYQRWMEGTLTLDELKAYATNYYPHVLAFPTYVSAVHSNAEDLELRKELLENLIEEERGEENHPELWLRFGESLGMTRDEISDGERISEATSLVQTFKSLTHKSLASGLGALYAYESQVPKIAEQKINGLKDNYGITDPRGIAFFAVHQKADEWHSETTRKAIEALTEEKQVEARKAALEASKALWNFLSGLECGRSAA